MDKSILSEIPASAKIDFLSKLQSGNFTLKDPYRPQPPLNFELQDEDGLYRCKETGILMSQEEIGSLPGYRLNIEIIKNRDQVSGGKPPSGISLMPFSRMEYLNSLLKNKDDKVLTFDEASGEFRTETESYSFEQLMQNFHDDLDSFVMDGKTAKKYIESLEKWCGVDSICAAK